MGVLSATIAGKGYPVLDGLEKAGIAGRYIAGIADVSASTVSKWRNGGSVMGDTTVVFLTLVLASLIEDMEALERRLIEEGCAWNDMFGDQLADLQGTLKEQEVYNATIAPHMVRAGAGLFRQWLEKNDGIAGTMVNRGDYPWSGDQPVAPPAE
jgi:hypothetical protein